VDDWWLHGWQWEGLLKHAEYQAVALLGEILFFAAVLAPSMVQAVCRQSVDEPMMGDNTCLHTIALFLRESRFTG
jgi:hypothetical protein